MAVDIDRIAVERLRDQVNRVNRIQLIGAPDAIVFDEWTLLAPDGQVPPHLDEKIRALAAGGASILLLRSLDEVESHYLSFDLKVRGIDDPAALSQYSSVVAILSRRIRLLPEIFVWYVGSGEDSHAATRTSGTAAAEEILGLLGTAEVQARAGAAFRAAGAGGHTPASTSFDLAILTGITRAISSNSDQVHKLAEAFAEREDIDLSSRTADLIAAALRPLLECQAPSGAIAAAPRPKSPDDPNYWFFWQRDAAHVAMSMRRLAKSQVDERFKLEASRLVTRYVGFVEQLATAQDVERLGVSRFDTNGRPIEGYGNPQVDGPAQTVLAVSQSLEDRTQALAILRPYLEYLVRHGGSQTFGPWEFAAGDIFFSQYLARKALLVGSHLARQSSSEDLAERCWGAARELERSLAMFCDPARGYVLAGRNLMQPFINSISHLDIAVVGAVLTAFGSAEELVPLDDPLLRGTIWSLEHAFAARWPVNAAWQRNGNCGMGMGRFPEDMNDGLRATGGNPWTFATLWAAQYYYRLADRVRVTSPGASADERQNLLDHADGYLRFVLAHLKPDNLTEQIDGETGLPRGAEKLAWSHAGLIDTVLLRQSVLAQA